MHKKSLEQRMKEYENVWRNYLPKRMPMIIRLDGKSFHTFTRGLNKPIDLDLQYALQETTKYLVKHIEGCVLGYQQSDEISLLIVDYQKFETNSWFDKNIQKICSVSASMATGYFNHVFQDKNLIEPYKILKGFKEKIAFFDSRCFVLTKDEVVNYFIWRQQDCMRNFILGIGQSKFSQKSLNNKTCNDIINMLKEIGIDLDEENYRKYKYGFSTTKDMIDIEKRTPYTILGIDNLIIFKNSRDYVEKLINCEVEQ